MPDQNGREGAHSQLKQKLMPVKEQLPFAEYSVHLAIVNDKLLLHDQGLIDS